MKGVFKTMVKEHLSVASGAPEITPSALLKIGGKIITAIRVISFTRSSNFVESCFDTFHFSLAISADDYQYQATQNHGDIEITLNRRAGGENLPALKFRGIILGANDPHIAANTSNLAQAGDMSLSVITVEALQIMAWDLRVNQIGGTFKETTPLALARYILAKTRLVDGVSNQDYVVGINYVKEDQKDYKDIVVPDGTPFLGVFDYIQNRYGIYSKGLGVYLRDKAWYLFTPYDANQFNQDTYRMVIYNVPQDMMSLPDRTYTVKNKTITIAATGETSHIDDRDTVAVNDGTGYRVGSVRALELRTTSHTEDGESETTPDDYMSNSNPAEHSSGTTNAPMVAGRLKDDDKSIMSAHAARTGTQVKVMWQGSIPYTLVPGMPVKFIYPIGEKTITRYGTLVGELYHTYPKSNGMIDKEHLSMTELTIWLGKK